MKSNRNAVGWFEIYVQDMERAKAFYQKTLQVTLEHIESPDIEMWAFPPLQQPDNPGGTGSLVKMEGKDSGVGGTIIYFVCEDCAVEAGRAAQNGGKVSEGEDVDWPLWLHRSRSRPPTEI